MFVFVVEDGTGLSNATSYVDVPEADDILVTNHHAYPLWEALDVEEQQRLLSWASTYLDTHARWNGRRISGESALRWPRSGVRDRDGITIADNEIPRQLKRATAEMARHLITDDRSSEREQDGLRRLKADIIELEFIDGYRLPQIPSQLHHLVKGLGVVTGGTPRMKWIRR